MKLRRPRRPVRAVPQSLAWLGIVAFFALVALVAARLDPAPETLAGQAYAGDGDTLHIGGARIRLLGIDAPELDQVCWDKGGAEWPCGKSARGFLQGLVAGAEIACRPTGKDRYGRWLAVCTAAGRDLGKAMIQAGLAVSYDDYGLEELAARAAGLGIWAGRFDAPRTWRDQGPSEAPRGNWLDWLLGGIP